MFSDQVQMGSGSQTHAQSRAEPGALREENGDDDDDGLEVGSHYIGSVGTRGLQSL